MSTDTKEVRQRLPDSPEPMKLLQARWPAALTKLWDIDDPAFDPNNGPGKQREHVFDTEAGFRFIASREQYTELNGGKPHLHVSASFREGSAVQQIVAAGKSKRDRIKRFFRAIQGAFAEISGIKLPDEPTMITGGGIPHYALDWESVAETQKTAKTP